jgi:histidinol-phosphate aminotransferase
MSGGMKMIETLARKCIFEHPDYIPGKPVEEVKKELGLSDIIKLASNENPLGTSPLALKAMQEELMTNTCRYPVSLCPELARKIAQRLGVRPSQIYIDNGEDAVITMFGLTFFNPGEEIITSSLTFAAYANIAAKMGARLIKVPATENGDIDLEGVARAVSDRTKAIFICNPNNPTGKIVTHAEVTTLLNKVPANVLVVLDEAYIDFVDDVNYPRSLDLLSRYPNLLLMRTFSKVYGLAGIRCGYAIASDDIVRMMLKAREPFPVNRLAQVGALAALDDTEFRERTLKNNCDAKKYFYNALDRMGIAYYRTCGNFICIKLKDRVNEVYEKLLKKGIITRPCAGMGDPEGLRITFGTQQENERAVKALKECL